MCRSVVKASAQEGGANGGRSWLLSWAGKAVFVTFVMTS